jgi:hypothetical protein
MTTQAAKVLVVDDSVLQTRVVGEPLREAGYQVCRALRQDENTAHVPVVMLTSKGVNGWGTDKRMGEPGEATDGERTNGWGSRGGRRLMSGRRNCYGE